MQTSIFLFRCSCWNVKLFMNCILLLLLFVFFLNGFSNFCKSRGSLSSSINASCRTKIESTFQIVLLKKFIHISIYESSGPIKYINCLSDKSSICILIVSEMSWKQDCVWKNDLKTMSWNVMKTIIWWLEFGCKNRWQLDSVIKLG